MTQTTKDAGASLTDELASMTRMFHSACADLGLINEALGLAPDDGGAAPILEAISELKSARDKWVDANYASTAVQAEGVRVDEVAVVKSLIDVVRATFIALDDSEEGIGDDGRIHVIDSANFDAVCTTMERLEELPDDRPGCTMDAPGKAEWALRNLLAARSGDDARTPVRFFVYDHEGGYDEFKTDAERCARHQAAIDAYLDTGCDGWNEEVTQVVSGIVTHKTVRSDLQHKPAPCAAHPDHDDESCDECAAWNDWNHDFDTTYRYEPEPLAAPASSTGDQV